MKKALPANAKISKDAKETMHEWVYGFISFITREASNKCQLEKRKTINGDELFLAMTTLGFEDYIEPLKVYLQKFCQLEGENGVVGVKGVVMEARMVELVEIMLYSTSMEGRGYMVVQVVVGVCHGGYDVRL